MSAGPACYLQAVSINRWSIRNAHYLRGFLICNDRWSKSVAVCKPMSYCLQAASASAHNFSISPKKPGLPRFTHSGQERTIEAKHSFSYPFNQVEAETGLYPRRAANPAIFVCHTDTFAFRCTIAAAPAPN